MFLPYRGGLGSQLGGRNLATQPYNPWQMYLCTINGSLLMSLKAPNKSQRQKKNKRHATWDWSLKGTASTWGLRWGSFCLQLWSSLISVGPLGCCHISATISSSHLSLWNLSTLDPTKDFNWGSSTRTYTTDSSEALPEKNVNLLLVWLCEPQRARTVSKLILSRSQLSWNWNWSDSFWIS